MVEGVTFRVEGVGDALQRARVQDLRVQGAWPGAACRCLSPALCSRM